MIDRRDALKAGGAALGLAAFAAGYAETSSMRGVPLTRCAAVIK